MVGVVQTLNWRAVAERAVTALGYEAVDVERSSRGLLRVTIDRVPGRSYAGSAADSVTVEDCEAVTRQLQYVLEVEGVDYQRLEVSSPGLDRPLRSPADLQRFVGHRVELALRQPFQGRRRFSGVLLAGEDAAQERWRLVLEDEPAPGRKTLPGAPRRAASRKAAAPPAPPGERVLDFEWVEVREARLVPVLDFKGRSPGAAAAPAGETQVEGGRER
jgi:ribosome maturation factor RimP